MYNTSFFKKLILILVALILYSCDKDYNAIGADLLGENHFDFLQYTSAYRDWETDRKSVV